MDAELRRLAAQAGGHTTDTAESCWEFGEDELAEFAALTAERCEREARRVSENPVASEEQHQGAQWAADLIRGVATGWRSPRTPEGQ